MASRILLAGWWTGTVITARKVMVDNTGASLLCERETSTMFDSALASGALSGMLMATNDVVFGIWTPVGPYYPTFHDITYGEQTIPSMTNLALTVGTGVVSGSYRWPVHNTISGGSVKGYDTSNWSSYAGSISAATLHDWGTGFLSTEHTYSDGGISYTGWCKSLIVTFNASITALRLHFVEDSGIDAYWEGSLAIEFYASCTHVRRKNSDGTLTETPVSAHSLGANSLTIRRNCTDSLSVYGDYAVSGTPNVNHENPVELTEESTVTVSAS